ncbi:putative protein NAP1 [Platanthera guangdongensis]|uniref:Uncharacterized protein n=1 Tax=Platanthera guangdongensis TaxID=2320717 RepID=A0ABR2MBC6_9ASPA
MRRYVLTALKLTKNLGEEKRLASPPNLKPRGFRQVLEMSEKNGKKSPRGRLSQALGESAVQEKLKKNGFSASPRLDGISGASIASYSGFEQYSNNLVGECMPRKMILQVYDLLYSISTGGRDCEFYHRWVNTSKVIDADIEVLISASRSFVIVALVPFSPVGVEDRESSGGKLQAELDSAVGGWAEADVTDISIGADIDATATYSAPPSPDMIRGFLGELTSVAELIERVTIILRKHGFMLREIHDERAQPTNDGFPYLLALQQQVETLERECATFTSAMQRLLGGNTTSLEVHLKKMKECCQTLHHKVTQRGGPQVRTRGQGSWKWIPH